MGGIERRYSLLKHRHSVGDIDGLSGTTSTAVSGGGVVVDVFTTPGGATWTKPEGAALVEIYCTGGGGGGGGGRSSTSPTNAYGGGGGAGAGRGYGLFLASELDSTEQVTVGTGGRGGAGGNAGGGNGSAGGDGSVSLFSSRRLVAGPGGAGGGGGTTTAGARGSNSGGLGVGNLQDVSLAEGLQGGIGGAASGGGGANTATTNPYIVCGGGGGGAGVSAGVPGGGGSSSRLQFGGNTPPDGAAPWVPYYGVDYAGGTGVGVADGENGISLGMLCVGGGGGGGAGRLSATGFSGGIGAQPGGGGGGGGGVQGASVVGGSGGRGGHGVVVVITYLDGSATSTGSGLSPVDIQSPQTGDALRWDGDSWTNAPIEYPSQIYPTVGTFTWSRQDVGAGFADPEGWYIVLGTLVVLGWRPFDFRVNGTSDSMRLVGIPAEIAPSAQSLADERGGAVSLGFNTLATGEAGVANLLSSTEVLITTMADVWPTNTSYDNTCSPGFIIYTRA